LLAGALFVAPLVTADRIKAQMAGALEKFVWVESRKIAKEKAKIAMLCERSYESAGTAVFLRARDCDTPLRALSYCNACLIGLSENSKANRKL
jgi:hypothetical protein